MRGSRGRAHTAPPDDEPWAVAEIVDLPSSLRGADGDERFPVAELDDPAGSGRAAHRPPDDDTAPAPRSDTGASRRIRVAWVALALVAVLGFASGAHLAVEHVPGAAAGVWHDGPSVGSCADLAGGFAVVPCDGPHDAEITRVDGPLPGDHADAAPSDQDADAVCRRAADDYTGATAGATSETGGGWVEPGINDVSTVVSAPPDERTGPFGWTACAVRPAVAQRYLGRVHGAADGGPVPTAYRTCFGPDGVGDAVSCAAPHTVEQLALLTTSPMGDFGWEFDGGAGAAGDGGTDGDGARGVAAPAGQDPSGRQDSPSGRDSSGRQDSPASSPPGQDDGFGMTGLGAIQFADIRDEVHAQCEQAVSAVLGTDDPTYGGRLAIETAPGENSGPILVWRTAGGGRYSTIHAIGLSGPNLCLVSTVDGGRLTDSLVGWGDAPLPLTDG